MSNDPIRKRALTETVQEGIVKVIRDRGLKPGDALPGELEFAEHFQVSRTVVREVLSRLRLIGLVETRKRRGTVLRAPDLFGMFRLALDPAFLQPRTSRELFELRLVLEMGMVDLLFMNREKLDLAMLDQLAERIERATDENERVRLDIEFHASLYRATGNQTLAMFQQLLRAFFQQVLTLEHASRSRSGGVDHRVLTRLLRRGAREDFRAAMRGHLAPHFERLAEHEDLGARRPPPRAAYAVDRRRSVTRGRTRRPS